MSLQDLKNKMKQKKNNKGFTLVEIIVVLVILSILMAALVPSMIGFVNEAKGKAYVTEARSAYVALQSKVTEKAATGTAYTDATIVKSKADGGLGLGTGATSALISATELSSILEGSYTSTAKIYAVSVSGANVTGMVYSVTSGTDTYYIKIKPNTPAEVSKTALTLP